MRPNSNQDDVVELLRELRLHDVSPSRARRLRARCHDVLKARTSSGHVSDRTADVWPRAIRILAGAWCVLYVFETIRFAAAFYGF